MHPVPPYIMWKITCRSCDEAKLLERWLSSRIDLDRTLVDTVHTMPNGVEHVNSVPRRLGDYFTAIRVLPGVDANANSFRLRFERRPNAARFWKDLMVSVLQEIEASPEKPTVAVDSKGEPEEALTRE
ncbi:MAG: hypothetical protein B7Z73_01815 [Planctomycetia bacterium 21-64-5]|nr:MAG: hypothetical protein B7Z73_01815 [Planctomycetia bacterium 21-64-5]HQU41598.1 hypothetical protein [Pirellulales bacterium]